MAAGASSVTKSGQGPRCKEIKDSRDPRVKTRVIIAIIGFVFTFLQ
jgi:hypothetical protein